MIPAPGVSGVAFGTVAEGDGRHDRAAREAIADELGVPYDWAVMKQTHSTRVVPVSVPGPVGEADGLVTSTPMLPLAVATADCVPVALIGDHAVGVVHAGWRGVAGGIVSVAVDELERLGSRPHTAVIGPHIGPCCFEVGDEVVEAIGGFEATTRWGTRSVDLGLALEHQLAGMTHVRVEGCTRDDPRFASYRENGTKQRQVAVVWLPQT